MKTQPLIESCNQEFHKIEEMMSQKTHCPYWLKTLKKSALLNLHQQGMPGMTHPEWRHFPMNPLVNHHFVLSPPPSPITIERALALAGRHQIDQSIAPVVILDGYVLQGKALGKAIPGLEINCFSDALTEHCTEVEERDVKMTSLMPWFQTHAFTAMNTAMFHDGLFICIGPNQILPETIQIILISSHEDRESSMSFPRLLVHVRRNSSAKLIQTHLSLNEQTGDRSQVLSNSVTQLVLEEGAQAEFYRLRHSPDHLYDLSTFYVTLDARSSLEAFDLNLRNRLSRNYMIVQHRGEGSVSKLSGLSGLVGDDHSDQIVQVDHLTPKGTSHQNFRAILADSAQSFFRSKVVIHRDACNVEATHSSQHLLLSDHATTYVSPDFEINAEPVTYRKDTSIGGLEQEALDDLLERGVPLSKARRMLLEDFIQTVSRDISFKPLRLFVENEQRSLLDDFGKAFQC